MKDVADVELEGNPSHMMLLGYYKEYSPMRFELWWTLKGKYGSANEVYDVITL